METSFVESVRSTIQSMTQVLAMLGGGMLGVGTLLQFYSATWSTYLDAAIWSFSTWLAMFF